MSLSKTDPGRNEKKQSRLLPKNYRQIGEPGTRKIYIEDYVYTYLNRMAQPGNLYARGAILFGKAYHTAAGPCLFISGAAACQSIEFDLEEPVFPEEVWSEIYHVRDTFFPELEICGWFLSRMGFSVELNDKIIRMHMDNFNGEHKVLYMIDALENEDAFYQLENYSLKRQKGYYIYYESNHEMADYMLKEGETGGGGETAGVSSELRRDSSVVRNYKKTLQKKKNTPKKKGYRWTPSMAAGAAVVLMALVYGAYSVHQFRRDEQMRAAFGQLDQTIESTVNDQTDSTRSSGKEDFSDLDDTETAKDTEDSFGETKAEEPSGDSEEDSDQEDSSEESREKTDREKAEDDTDEDREVFTQEDPDDAVESWAYIGGEYTVKRGDTLASISMEIYDSYDYIQKIADENNIENVNQIYPGQVLKIPLIDD